MKKLISILLCLLLFSCKEETIPVVNISMLPTQLVGLGQDSLFDTIPYQIVSYQRDTATNTIDTIITDTFHIDTFFVDTLRLGAIISYAGQATHPYGPALREYGFCINSTDTIPMWQASDELKTAECAYDSFFYEMTARTIDRFFVHAYAINPVDEKIRSLDATITVSLIDTTRTQSPE